MSGRRSSDKTGYDGIDERDGAVELSTLVYDSVLQSLKYSFTLKSVSEALSPVHYTSEHWYQLISSKNFGTVLQVVIWETIWLILTMSRFDCVEAAPAIEIFALSKAYKEDTFAQKVDLGIGGNVKPVRW